MRLTAGTANLRDGDAPPTFFADLVGFTECHVGTVAKHAREAGRDVYWRQNHTIALVTPSGYYSKPVIEWHRAHDGIAGLTPARGDLVVYDRDDTSKPAVIVSHRINDKWKPGADRRWTRIRLWRIHRRQTEALIRDLEAEGYRVIALGDMNTKPGKDRDGKPLHRAFSRGLMREFGTRLDRIAVTPPLTVTEVKYLDGMGSDHPRLKVTVKFT